MSEPFLGSLMAVAFNFAPKNWAQCSGQLLPINQNQAIFSLLGTTYGGNGQTTFGLPDLRGRAPLSYGQGPGLQNYALGQVAGEENVTLSQQQLPTHNHQVQAISAGPTTKNPSGSVLAGLSMYNTVPPDAAAGRMNPSGISTLGGSQAHENRTPFLVINWIIALNGIFPSRN